MNRSELHALLESAQYGFEGRFDERWALEWMQQNWWVPKGGRCCKARKSRNFSCHPWEGGGGESGSGGTINAAHYVTAVESPSN